MKSIVCLLFLAIVATLTGCTGIKVSSECDQSYDFSRIATYRWVDAPAEILNADDTYLNEDIQQALNNELVAHGWTQVSETDAANINVVYYIKLKEQQEYSAGAEREDRDFSGGFVYNRDKKWGYEEREPDLNVYTVEIGTLTLLAYDTKTGERVWRGSLQTKLDRSKPISKQQEMITNVAHKLVERIPAGK